MDFTLDEDVEAARELARTIFAALPVGDAEDRWESTWSTLVESGLLSMHLPEAHGGSGLGLAATAGALEEQGRLTAAAPLWPLVVASRALARFAPNEIAARVLPSIVDGTHLVTSALEEFASPSAWAPATTAVPSADGGWRLTGEKASVPFAGRAHGLVVSATDADGPALFFVGAAAAGIADPTGLGIAGERAVTTDGFEARHVALRDAPAIRLGGAEELDAALDVAVLSIAATELGVMQGALRLAAGYLTDRRQFGRPLATFQAAQHKLADCYIDIEATRVTVWQATEHLDEGSDMAHSHVAVAQWWAAESGMDLVHRTQHLHGGIGVDRDYPAHRFYLWARQLSGTLGGADGALERIGDTLLAVEQAR